MTFAIGVMAFASICEVHFFIVDWMNENHGILIEYGIYSQEARRAAEKAYDVAKVDERVNRAVAAANRAANSARVAAVKAVQKQMHHRSTIDEIPIPIVQNWHIPVS